MPDAARLVLLAAALSLGGCAGSEPYPSLALRPVETQSLSEPVRPAPPAGTQAAAADARYAPLVDQARRGDDVFRDKLAAAGPVLARARTAAVGSDAWGDAQTVLSRLQAARDPVAAALLALQAASEGPEARADSGLTAAAARALDTVADIDRREAAQLAAVTPTRS